MIQQGTPEWFSERSGKVTASRVADIIAKTKSGRSATRQNYLAQLVAERLTGFPSESFSSQAMQWGTEQEPFARAAYEVKTGLMVDEVGFIAHPSIAMSGASPDGIIGNDGLIEIKCPNTATHIDYLLTKAAPNKYHAQMAFQLMCTGRKWCDFVSFDPRMPKELQLLVVRFAPLKEYMDEIATEINAFLLDVQNTVESLIKIAV